jgi:hypothetical protein
MLARILLRWERLIGHVLVTLLKLRSRVITLDRDALSCVGCHGCLIEPQLLVGRFGILVAVVAAVTPLTEYDQILGVIVAAFRQRLAVMDLKRHVSVVTRRSRAHFAVAATLADQQLAGRLGESPRWLVWCRFDFRAGFITGGS